MTPAFFLETREPAWRRIEELVARAARGPGRLSGSELNELARQYPAMAVDVARARMLGLDASVQQRVNWLAIRAHGLLYRRRSTRRARAVKRFLLADYPRLFRRLRWHFLVALAVFGFAALGSYVTTRIRPVTARVFVPGGLDVPFSGREVTAEDVSERYRLMAKPVMASAITTNNIQVAFYAFASGILLGLGTCYVLLGNGMMLGAFFGHFANHGLSYEVWSFLTPHGALEIFAILVAGTAGLRMGLSLAVPGGRTRGASLRHGAREAVKLLLGTIPMFVVAGAIESFVTPSYLPGYVKIIIGLAVLAVTLGYLLLVGREGDGEPSQAPAPIRSAPAARVGG